jgi:hypothetical protein
MKNISLGKKMCILHIRRCPSQAHPLTKLVEQPAQLDPDAPALFIPPFFQSAVD